MADVRVELENAINQLGTLLEQKEKIEVEIAKQRRKVAAWQELYATEDGEELPSPHQLESLLDLGGLTDAIRTVLRASRKEWINTSEIMTGLRDLGFPLSKYKAPMASIITTVNRLVPSEVTIHRLPNGGSEYKWVGPISFLDELGAGLARAAEEAAKKDERDRSQAIKDLQSRTSRVIEAMKKSNES